MHAALDLSHSITDDYMQYRTSNWMWQTERRTDRHLQQHLDCLHGYWTRTYTGVCFYFFVL